MATWQYNPTAATSRPPCFGNPQVRNNASPSCQRCPSSADCVSTIQQSGRPVAAPYYGPTPTQSYTQPQLSTYIQPKPFIPPPPPGYQHSPPLGYSQQPQVQGYHPPQPQPQFAAPAFQQNTGGDQYGWFQDPLHQWIAGSPPPVRPQMQGESFAERIGKNIILAIIESLLTQCLLAFRQVRLPPKIVPLKK